MLENINEIMITCEKHPSQMITHICCLDTCLSPLCVNCMKNHNSYHKKENVFPEIEALEDVREFCCEKLFYLIENYNKELDKIKFVSSPKKPDPNLKKLLFYRDKIISFINAYFSELEKEYEKKNRPITDEAYSISNLLEYFRKMIKNLEDYLQEVKYNCSLETIQNILVADFQQDFELMKAKSQELSHNFSSQKTILLFDDEKIHHIFQEVEKITTFNTYHNNNDLIKSTPHSNKLIFETMRIPVISPIENSIITTHNTKSFTKNESIINFEIKNADYFNKATTAKFLHFFQQKSRCLHIYNLEELKNNIVKEYKLELDINFKIPRWHRSISIPNGSIYLIGGVISLSQNQETTSNLAYLYDFEANTLNSIAPMKLPRSGHGITYMNDKIYCIGGFTNENICSRLCEIYNVSLNFWQEIAPLNYEANNACVCSFQHRFVYKFGGKLEEKELNNYIERYCPIDNIWSIIHIKSEKKLNNFTLLSSSACCQINKNQIYVFGGTYEDYSQKSSQSFLLEIRNQKENYKNQSNDEECYDLHVIKCINDKTLPSEEGFWNNNPIVFDSELYCLQNIPNMNNLNIVYNDRRKILKFDFKKNWVAFN